MDTRLAQFRVQENWVRYTNKVFREKEECWHLSKFVKVIYNANDDNPRFSVNCVRDNLFGIRHEFSLRDIVGDRPLAEVVDHLPHLDRDRVLQECLKMAYLRSPKPGTLNFSRPARRELKELPAGITEFMSTYTGRDANGALKEYTIKCTFNHKGTMDFKVW